PRWTRPRACRALSRGAQHPHDPAPMKERVMTEHARYVESLSAWYMREARPFLNEVAGDRVSQIDQERERLEKLCKMLEADLPVCFLGTAGVGKSTLINAVVA